MTVALYPPYSTTGLTWIVGADDAAGSSGVADGMSGTSEGWFVRTMRLRVNPGTYTLSTIHAGIFYAATAKCDAVRFGIFGGTTSSASLVTLSNGLTYVDVTANKADTDASQAFEGALGSVTVTIESGTTYWFALMMHKVAGSTSGYPGIRQMNDGQWALGDLWKGSVSGATMPTTTADLTYVAAGDAAGEQSRIALEFTTPAKKVYSIDATAYAGTATELIIPRESSASIAYQWICFKSCVVADGQALTIVFENDNSADERAMATLVLDMGGTDRVTFGGANVNLDAGAEVEDTFDLGVCINRTTGKANLFYVNLTTGQGAQGAADFCTKSHASINNAAGDGSRNQLYTISSLAYSLKISGTATIGAIEVGHAPLVIFGDSQAINASDRLGSKLGAAFTYDMITWNAALSGGKLTADVTSSTTAGYQRYKNDTVGLGDICEMPGIMFCVAGYGINDISGGVGTTEANRNKTVALMGQRLCEILYDVASNGNSILIIGLPPYSDGSASTEEALTVKNQWNPMLEGIAVGLRCAYVNPWHAMCQSGTTEAAIPTFNSSYTSDSGLHYASAGAAIVAAAIAQAYETNIVGGWWSAPWRRLSRRKGSLWPI